MLTSDFVFIGVSIALIAAYTAYNIWEVRRKIRLFQEIKRQLEENQKASEQPPRDGE